MAHSYPHSSLGDVIPRLGECMKLSYKIPRSYLTLIQVVLTNKL